MFPLGLLPRSERPLPHLDMAYGTGVYLSREAGVDLLEGAGKSWYLLDIREGPQGIW